MKKIYLIVFIFIFSAFQAQIINIPDANFKAYLLSANTTNYIALDANNNPIVINSNGDNEIQLSEASLVKTLNISGSSSTVGSQIGSIVGIKSFVNVSKLSVQDISNNNFTFFDVSGMTSLTDLFAANYYISGFNVDNCTNLDKISIYGGNFQTLTLNVPSLTYLSVNDNLTSLNFQGCPNIKTLKLENIMLNAINLNNISNLEELTISSYGFPWLNNTVSVTNCSALKKVFLYGPNVQSVTISNNPLLTDITSTYFSAFPIATITNNPILKNISLVDSDITTLTLTGSPLLETFDVDENSLTSVNLTAFPILKTVKCSENNLTSLDLSANPLITYVDCSDNNLQTINFKNGGATFPYNFIVSNNPGMQYFCCDPQDVATANYYLVTMYGYSNVNINSYCSFTPGGVFYTINGNTKYDSNNNGCDTLDPVKALQNFLVTTGTTSANFSANSTGTHFIPLQAGNHTISPILENPAYFNISPASITANFPTQTSPLIQNFCLTANGTHNDLEVVVLPITAASPGFNSKYKIICKNKGTTTQSGTIVYNFDDNLMNFLSSTTAPNSQSFGVLNYNFSNLLPFETKEITLNFNLNTPTQIPPLNGGHILNYSAQINGLVDDTPADNAFTLNQIVVNSFDPNDKTCLEGTTISQAKVGDYVHYMIRFENTGTANAHNIVVKDVIDTSKFDIATLQALHGSHSFVARITSPNIVEFIFENIQLPFDNANNDGYVTFKIKTISTLTLGQSFNNTANIYFDYNFPIITNTYTTTVQNTLATSEINNDKVLFNVYPNPVNDILYIKTEAKITKAEIYDTTGRIVLSTGFKNNSVDVSNLPKGNYIVKFFMTDKTVTQKFIKN